MIMARSQPETDQSARIRHRLRLPSVIGLIAPHRIFAGLVPGSSRRATQIMFADQSFLNRLCPLGIDFLLPARLSPAALPITGVSRLPATSRGCRSCFRRLGRRRVRRRMRGRSLLCRTFRRSRFLRARRPRLASSVGSLRVRSPRSNPGTDQRQGANHAQPSPPFRAMPMLQVQLQTLEDRPLPDPTRLKKSTVANNLLNRFATKNKTQLELAIVIILYQKRQCQFRWV